MKAQFIRLFLLIIISLIVIGWLTEEFIERAEEQSPLVNVQALKPFISQGENNAIALSNTKFITIKNLAWPDDLTEKLAKGEIVSLSNINHQVFYYWLLPDNPEMAVEFGPFLQETENSSLYLLLSILFYGVFALLLFIWLWPIFKDVIELIRLTDQFSKKRVKINSYVKKSSVMYPLASSVESMSRQIVRFLSLQRFLASSVSHDIRTPLSRISFLLAMSNAENLNDYKVKIDAELDEIDRLTDDFIELARIEEFHHQLTIAKENIYPWLIELIDRVQSTTSVQIDLTADERIIINHDINFLQRAVQNLLVNAVKYAVDKVQITIIDSDDEIEIRVEDDGTGIKPEEQERITGLYERGQSSKNIGSGYGIGLAFVNVIAEWHGAEVLINQSITLGGACVCIILPK